jgi:hypothetical protein
MRGESHRVGRCHFLLPSERPSRWSTSPTKPGHTLQVQSWLGATFPVPTIEYLGAGPCSAPTRCSRSPRCIAPPEVLHTNIRTGNPYQAARALQVQRRTGSRSTSRPLEGVPAAEVSWSRLDLPAVDEDGRFGLRARCGSSTKRAGVKLAQWLLPRLLDLLPVSPTFARRQRWRFDDVRRMVCSCCFLVASLTVAGMASADPEADGLFSTMLFGAGKERGARRQPLGVGRSGLHAAFASSRSTGQGEICFGDQRSQISTSR